MNQINLSAKKNKSAPFLNPIVVALDVDDRDTALRISDDLADIVGGFKLGPRLCLRYGQDFIKAICDRGPVFIDQKFFDIPSTMVAAVQASFDAGASVVTVHSLSGLEALKAIAALEVELNKIRPFRILCVTILTSWTENSYPPIFKDGPVLSHVQSLAQMTCEAGLTGIVCSPQELECLDLSNHNRDMFYLTPGVRMVRDDWGDQKRVMAPDAAMKAGASALVVGRPIIEAKNPKASATDYVMAVFN